MTKPGTDEARAREVLACAYDDIGDSLNANRIRSGQYVCEEVDVALRAIGRAFANEQASAQAIPADEVEKLAQFLHDEGGFGDAITGCTWPEHLDDTGRRENGWVKIVPSDVQAHFRDVARRWLATPKASAQGVGEDYVRDTFRIAMVDAARARGGAGAQFIVDGHSNLWLDIAYDAAAISFTQIVNETVERAANYLDGLAKEEDFAITVADTPSDKGRCGIIAAEFRRAAKGIRALASTPEGRVSDDVDWRLLAQRTLAYLPSTLGIAQDIRAALNPTPGDAK